MNLSPDPKRIVAALLRAIEAKDRLLACYRMNAKPSESLFSALSKAKQAVVEARFWLGEQAKKPAGGAS